MVFRVVAIETEKNTIIACSQGIWRLETPFHKIEEKVKEILIPLLDMDEYLDTFSTSGLSIFSVYLRNYLRFSDVIRGFKEKMDMIADERVPH